MQPDPNASDAQEFNVIPMNFDKKYVPDKKKPGQFEEIHTVDLVKKGSNGDSTPWTIRALKKEQFIWPHVEKYYEAWLAGQEDPIDGTPLDVLSFLPPAIIQHLKNIHIRTAEDLASAEESALERIGMGARGWREKARTFLETKTDLSGVVEANAELKLQNEQLRGDIEDLRRQVNELVAEKPKRGRPRKDAA